MVYHVFYTQPVNIMYYISGYHTHLRTPELLESSPNTKARSRLQVQVARAEAEAPPDHEGQLGGRCVSSKVGCDLFELWMRL